MRRFTRLAIVVAIALLSTGVLLEADEPQDGGWRMLPLINNNQVHPDWVQIGWGSFVVDGDSLRTDCDAKGMGLLLYKPEQFGDCQIRIRFKSQDAKSNAGVFVRIDPGILKKIGEKAPPIQRGEGGRVSDEMLEQLKTASEKELGAWYPVHHGYEVQICDQADPLHRTGAIYSLAQAEPALKPASNEWRSMTITLKGNLIQVEIDGKQVTNFNPDSTDVPKRRDWYEPKRDAKRPLAGYIGLQNHDPGDVVYFKEISVRPLSTTR